MVGGFAAPARRVGFFLHDETASNMTEDAATLLEDVLRWAASIEELPSVEGGASFSEGLRLARNPSNFVIDEIRVYDGQEAHFQIPYELEAASDRVFFRTRPSIECADPYLIEPDAEAGMLLRFQVNQPRMYSLQVLFDYGTNEAFGLLSLKGPDGIVQGTLVEGGMWPTGTLVDIDQTNDSRLGLYFSGASYPPESRVTGALAPGTYELEVYARSPYCGSHFGVQLELDLSPQ
jgi:hypothetical protein